MTKVTNIGNLPKFLTTFLSHRLFGEVKDTVVYDCTYDEIVNKAQDEKLEPQVLIDKKDTGRAFLCAVGVSVEKDTETGLVSVPPVFYFAELDEGRKRMFIRDLQAARDKVVEDKKKHEEWTKIVTENTRNAGDEIRPNTRPGSNRQN